MTLESEEKWKLLHSKVQQKQIVDVFNIFRAEKIEPVLIKGFAVERFYPKGVARLSFDIDISVSPTQFERAKKIVLFDKLTKINIDLHEGLRHFDRRDWNELFSRTELIYIADTKVRVLSEEDHLRLLCIHWLTDGGENKQKLWDIYYLVTNRSVDFDWNKCFHPKLSNNRKNWIIYTIGLAHKHLKLDLDGFPYRDKALNLPNWLDRAINKIWNRKHPFIPLDSCFSDSEMFYYQLRLRLTPNPIMSIIGLEGDFDAKAIFPYQIRYFLKRSIPSTVSILKNIKFSMQKKNEK